MKYSVALCTYNGSRYLKEQIDSLVLQTRRPYEICVFDDKSTDDTINIIRSYIQKYPDIKIHLTQNEKNRGVIKNFEFALAACSGDFIFLCDQDDVWESTRIEKWNDYILQKRLMPSGVHFLFNDLFVVDSDGKDLKTAFFSEELQNFKTNPKLSGVRLLTKNWVPGCTTLVSQGLRDFALPFPKHIHMHDHWLFLLATHYGNVHFLDEKLIRYRQHDANTIGTQSLAQSLIFNFYKPTFVLKKIYRLREKRFQLKNLVERARERGRTARWPSLENYISCLQKFAPIKLFLLIKKERISGLGIMPWIFTFFAFSEN